MLTLLQIVQLLLQSKAEGTAAVEVMLTSSAWPAKPGVERAVAPSRLVAQSASLWSADQQLTLRQLMEYAEERRKSMAEELAKAQQGAPPQA